MADLDRQKKTKSQTLRFSHYDHKISDHDDANWDFKGSKLNENDNK